MNETLKIVLSLSLSGSLLMLILFLLRPVFKERLSKRWQYYIWLVVIARLLLPFAPEMNLIGTIFQEIDKEMGQTEFIQTPGQDIPIASDFYLSKEAYAQKGQDIMSDGQTQPAFPDNTVGDLAAEISQNLWLVWLVAALILLVRKITVYQSFVKYIRAGCVEVSEMDLLERFGKLVEQNRIKNAVELYKNSLISSPILLGFFHPCIVLPSTHLPVSDFEYTIQHELTHYKWKDMFYKWLIQLTVCIHWFNPFVYLMSREVDRACELSCDEAVIRALDLQGRQAYGDTLLNAMDTGGKYKDSLASVTLSESKERLKERLDAVMKYKKHSKLTLALTLVLTIAVCSGAMVTGAYAAPKQTNPCKEEAAVSDGFTIHFNASAETGNGLEAGLVSTEDDPLNLETVTLKDKTYYMIMTKEQLLALAEGELDFDKNYMLQRDIDLSDVEWMPIGTVDKPFTGSFNGNGCEIKGLTMTNPDAKIIGMFGYADDANIYNITLRDYDITTAGKNVQGKSIAPVLVFGTDTECYDNSVFPKQ